MTKPRISSYGFKCDDCGKFVFVGCHEFEIEKIAQVSFDQKFGVSKEVFSLIKRMCVTTVKYMELKIREAQNE